MTWTHSHVVWRKQLVCTCSHTQNRVCVHGENACTKLRLGCSYTVYYRTCTALELCACHSTSASRHLDGDPRPNDRRLHTLHQPQAGGAWAPSDCALSAPCLECLASVPLRPLRLPAGPCSLVTRLHMSNTLSPFYPPRRRRPPACGKKARPGGSEQFPRTLQTRCRPSWTRMRADLDTLRLLCSNPGPATARENAHARARS